MTVERETNVVNPVMSPTIAGSQIHFNIAFSPINFMNLYCRKKRGFVVANVLTGSMTMHMPTTNFK